MARARSGGAPTEAQEFDAVVGGMLGSKGRWHCAPDSVERHALRALVAACARVEKTKAYRGVLGFVGIWDL